MKEGIENNSFVRVRKAISTFFDVCNDFFRLSEKSLEEYVEGRLNIKANTRKKEKHHAEKYSHS